MKFPLLGILPFSSAYIDIKKARYLDRCIILSFIWFLQLGRLLASLPYQTLLDGSSLSLSLQNYVRVLSSWHSFLLVRWGHFRGRVFSFNSCRSLNPLPPPHFSIFQSLTIWALLLYVVESYLIAPKIWPFSSPRVFITPVLDFYFIFRLFFWLEGNLLEVPQCPSYITFSCIPNILQPSVIDFGEN